MYIQVQCRGGSLTVSRLGDGNFWYLIRFTDFFVKFLEKWRFFIQKLLLLRSELWSPPTDKPFRVKKIPRRTALLGHSVFFWYPCRRPANPAMFSYTYRMYIKCTFWSLSFSVQSSGTVLCTTTTLFGTMDYPCRVERWKVLTKDSVEKRTIFPCSLVLVIFLVGSLVLCLTHILLQALSTQTLIVITSPNDFRVESWDHHHKKIICAEIPTYLVAKTFVYNHDVFSWFRLAWQLVV